MTNVSSASATNMKNDSLGTNRADFGLKSKFWDFVSPNFDELATIRDVAGEEGNGPPHARAADVTLEIRSADE